MQSESAFATAVKVWAAAAWADGVISPEEAMVMRAIVSSAKLTDDEKQAALGWLDNKIELADVDLSTIAVHDREHIYAAALGVVAIDKEIAEGETVFLGRLRQALEIGEETAKRMHAAAGLSS